MFATKMWLPPIFKQPETTHMPSITGPALIQAIKTHLQNIKIKDTIDHHICYRTKFHGPAECRVIIIPYIEAITRKLKHSAALCTDRPCGPGIKWQIMQNDNILDQGDIQPNGQFHFDYIPGATHLRIVPPEE